MSHLDWIDRQEYPFESHFLNLEAGRMHYVDQGRGQPVLMVHGNPTWSFLYRNLIKDLESDYRCVAMDHLGFGLSDKPTAWGYLPEDHSSHLATLIEALDLQDITLIVQDWGGPIGLSYAIDHPQNVRRIIILNTWMWPVNRDWYYVAFSGFTGGPIGRFLIKRYNFFVNSVMPTSYGDQRKLTPAIHQHYRKPLEVPEERKGCWVFPGQITGATPWLSELWDQREKLSGIPKLIAWGMKDIAFREKELNGWIAAYPQAQVARLEGVGHYVQEEGGQPLHRAVREFLEANQ